MFVCRIVVWNCYFLDVVVILIVKFLAGDMGSSHVEKCFKEVSYSTLSYKFVM